MEGSELILLLSLSAILVLLKYVQRSNRTIEKSGSGVRMGPVRERRTHD